MIKYFTSHPTAANLLMVIILIAGIMSVNGLLVSTFPEFDLGEVEIIVEYPGASPTEVEETVCLLIEDSLEGIPGLDEFELNAKEALAKVTVKMLPGFKFQSFLNDVKTRIEAISEFPDLVDSVTVQEKNSTEPVISIAVSADLPLSDLKLEAEQIKRELLEVEGINKVQIQGISKHYLRIRLSENKIRALGLDPQTIATKVFSQNIEMPGGIVKTTNTEYLIRYSDKRKTIDNLKEITILTAPSGTRISLGMVAEIEDTFEPFDIRTTFNNKPAILLSIEKNDKESSTKVFDTAQKFLIDKQASLPHGVSISFTRDYASLVKDRLDMIKTNGVQGFILVFVVLLLFFKPNQSFWVAAGLPVSFAGAFFFMNQFGISLNMISMVGLLMAIGLLMDDAIVISENILAKKTSGLSVYNAVIAGTAEVLPGVASSYLTTICVFGGLMFLDGDLGRIFSDMPTVLLIVMSVSLIEAFLILPHHLFASFSKESDKNTEKDNSINSSEKDNSDRSSEKNNSDKSSNFHNFIEKVFKKIEIKILVPSVKFCIKHRYAFIGTLIFVFLLSAAMMAGGILKFSALPEIDGDVMEARLIMPSGTPKNITESNVKKIVESLKLVNIKKTEELKAHGLNESFVKNYTVRYGINADTNETGGHLATITADLITAEKRTGRLDDAIDLWRYLTKTLPGAETTSFKEPFFGPAGKPIHIRLYSNNFKTLLTSADKITQVLKNYSGIHDVIHDLRLGKPELQIKLKPSAEMLGISATEISRQLRASFYGVEGLTLYENEEARELAVELSRYDQNKLSVLDDLKIISSDKRKIPLYELVDLKSTRGLSQISRVNRKRCVNIYAEVDKTKANVIEVLGELKKGPVKTLLEEKQDLRVEFKGEAETMGDVRPSMLRSIILGIIGIFIILSFQFKSFKEPIFIMGAVPLALIGVVWGHIIMEYNISMPSMVGFISLAGIVVNNSILMVQFIGINMKKSKNHNGVTKGLSLSEAAVCAASQRFRPILITSMTTVAGMLPLLLEKSLQAQILIPLTISVIFGMTISTVLILYFIPAIYSIVDDFKKK